MQEVRPQRGVLPHGAAAVRRRGADGLLPERGFRPAAPFRPPALPPPTCARVWLCRTARPRRPFQHPRLPVQWGASFASRRRVYVRHSARAPYFRTGGPFTSSRARSVHQVRVFFPPRPAWQSCGSDIPPGMVSPWRSIPLTASHPALHSHEAVVFGRSRGPNASAAEHGGRAGRRRVRSFCLLVCLLVCLFVAARSGASTRSRIRLTQGSCNST